MGTKIKLFPVLLIAFAVLTRLLPHPPNFAPITAIALFGGVYLPKRYAFLLPITALLLSDLILGFYGQTMVFVYISFIFSTCLGLFLKKYKNPITVLGSSLLASITFFLITNFAVWLEPQSWYPKDLSGLIQSYTAAIPFFRNTLAGDLFFTFTFFSLYEISLRLSKRYLPSKLLKIAF